MNVILCYYDCGSHGNNNSFIIDRSILFWNEEKDDDDDNDDDDDDNDNDNA